MLAAADGRASCAGRSRSTRWAGLTGKLGVTDDPIRHTAGDVAGRLRERTFPRVRQLLETLLGGAGA